MKPSIMQSASESGVTSTQLRPLLLGTAGHIDHGKTTLTAAITKVMAKDRGGVAVSYADIAKGGTVPNQ